MSGVSCSDAGRSDMAVLSQGHTKNHGHCGHVWSPLSALPERFAGQAWAVVPSRLRVAPSVNPLQGEFLSRGVTFDEKRLSVLLPERSDPRSGVLRLRRFSRGKLSPDRWILLNSVRAARPVAHPTPAPCGQTGQWLQRVRRRASKNRVDCSRSLAIWRHTSSASASLLGASGRPVDWASTWAWQARSR